MDEKKIAETLVMIMKRISENEHMTGAYLAILGNVIPGLTEQARGELGHGAGYFHDKSQQLKADVEKLEESLK